MTKTKTLKNVFEKVKNKLKTINLQNCKKFIQNILKCIYKFFTDRRLYITIVFVVLTLVIFYEHNYVAKYSVYSSDDFTHYMQMTNVEGFNPDDNFHNGIAYSKWHCEVWGGVYFGMFLQGFLGINNKVRDLVSLRFWMQVNVALYFISTFIFIFSLISNVIMRDKPFLEKLSVASALNFVVILLINGFNFYDEPWSWFSAAVSYSVGISFLLISFAILMSIRFKKKILNIIFNIIKILIAIPIAICSMGTSLAVVMMGFVFVAAFLIYAISLNIGHIVLSYAYIRSGIYNIMCPGNIARRGTAKQGIDIEETLNTLKIFLTKRIETINGKYIFVVCIILFSLLAAYFIYKNVQISRSYMLVSAFLLIMPFAVTGPIAVGYDPTWEFNRTDFMMDMSLIINLINIVILLCGVIIYLFENLIKENEKIVPIVVFALFIIVGLRGIKNLEKVDFNQFDGITVFNDIFNEKYKKFDEEYKLAFSELFENSGKDVAVVHYPNEDEKPKFLLYYGVLDAYMYKWFFDVKDIRKAKN